MAHSALRTDLQGVSAMLVSPFDDSGTDLELEALEANTNHLLNRGIRSFVPCGGTGEIASLTIEERRSVAETVADVVGNEGSVVAGVEGGIKDALRLVDLYEDAGVDGIMVRRGDHPARGPHQAALLEYYETIASSTDLGVMIYKDDPVATDGMVGALAALDNVVAVKYVDGSTEYTETRRHLSEEAAADLVWINGTAETNALAYGIEGVTAFTSSFCNVVPEASIALYEAMENGDWEKARQIRDRFGEFLDLYWGPGEDNEIRGGRRRAVIKYGIELAGRYGGPARVPVLPELSSNDKQQVKSAFEHLRTGPY